MKTKNKKTKIEKRSPAKLSSNISGAFSFDSHFKFHLNNDSNYKSIYSYRLTNDDEEGEEESTSGDYHALTFLFGALLVLFFPILGWFSLKIINKKHKLVVFRYGKLTKITNPGVTFVIPFIDTCQFVNTDTKESTITNASCPTRDQGLVEIDFTIKYRVSNVDYLIKHVINWDKLVLNEARFALLSGVKNFRWADFDGMRVAYDVENHIMQTLSTQLNGIEIMEAQITNIRQGKEPEPPIEILKKINFKALGQQLTSMSPFLMNPATGDSVNKQSAIIDDTAKEKALNSFFEKLEMIKNLALQNAQQLQPKHEQDAGVSSDAPVITLLSTLIKGFMRNNITMVNLSRIMSEQSLKCLFEDSKKVKDLSQKIEDVLQLHTIDGDVLFVVTKYFKSPCYFHYDFKLKMLENGFIEKYAMLVELI